MPQSVVPSLPELGRVLRARSAGLPRLLRNRYVLATLAFAVYITFFDHYSVVNRLRLEATLSELKAEQAEYARAIEESERLRATIQADEEKFAREHYYMKHADEDVFIVE